MIGMGASRGMQFSLSLVAVNIVLGDLGLAAPEPFHVPHPTQDTDERARLRDAVRRDLEGRGLMERARLDADVEQMLRAFVSSPLALLLVGTLGDGERIFARVCATPHFALQVVQDGQRMLFTEVHRNGVIPATVSLLPSVPAAGGEAITVPYKTPEPAPSEEDDFAASNALRAPSSAADATRRALERLGPQARLRTGMIMAIASEVPSGGGAVREVERRHLTWFDTEEGRYLQTVQTSNDGARWLTIAPADAGRIAQHLSGWLGG